MSKPVKISTVLTRAAKYISEHGWTQHSYFRHRNGKEVARLEGEPWGDYVARVAEKGCKACALGAIYIGARKDVDRIHELDDTFARAAGYAEKTLGAWPSGWNDEKDRTKDEVVTALKEAAKAARKDGK